MNKEKIDDLVDTALFVVLCSLIGLAVFSIHVLIVTLREGGDLLGCCIFCACICIAFALFDNTVGVR